MTRILLIFFLCMTSSAYAAQLRDYSQTPEETMRNAPSESATMESLPSYQNNNAPLPLPTVNNNQARFMDAYCNPTTGDKMANSNALSHCLKNARNEACRRYTSLPPDAKDAIDREVSCGVMLMGADAEDDPSSRNRCKNIEADNFQIIKKYKDDLPVAQALLTVPDLINKAGANCARSIGAR